jgi:hypothetical protein
MTGKESRAIRRRPSDEQRIIDVFHDVCLLLDR